MYLYIKKLLSRLDHRDNGTYAFLPYN